MDRILDYFEMPDIEHARVLLHVPVIDADGEHHVIKIPFVVDMEELVFLSTIFTRNGMHYTVQPIEIEVD